MRAIRRLVVNGDDFGLTPGVNVGILDAHQRGILTSASLLANAPAAADAIQIARRTPTLGVGCHLALVDGLPILPPDQVPTLAPGGAFRPTWAAFLTAALGGRIRLAEIERELAAQIERLRSGGLRLTHLDSHKHVHAYPPVFDIVAGLARRFGIMSVRVPCEGPPLALAARFATTPRARRQAVENLALVPWAWRDRRVLARRGLPPAPALLGRALTGVFTGARLREALAGVAEGTSELMCHPGYVDGALGHVRTRLRAARAEEVAHLTAPETLEAIRRAGILLVRHDGQGQRESHVA